MNKKKAVIVTALGFAVSSTNSRNSISVSIHALSGDLQAISLALRCKITTTFPILQSFERKNSSNCYTVEFQLYPES